MSSLTEFAAQVRCDIDELLNLRLRQYDDAAPELKAAMQYALLLGGKRSRPFLVCATGQMLNADRRGLLYAGAAIECVHAYSLVHDDMPEMDNDKTRRGHPTVHVKFSPATALLTGDALQTMGFELASDPKSGLNDKARAQLCAILSSGAGYDGMCGGQAMDLANEHLHAPLEVMRKLHAKKTGALILAAVRMGAACAPAELKPYELEALDLYARKTGLAFQIWDDVLDVIGDSKLMGKPVGNDAQAGKSTYPALMGLEAAEQAAKQAAADAIQALSVLPYDHSLLDEFAAFTVNRDH